MTPLQLLPSDCSLTLFSLELCSPPGGELTYNLSPATLQELLEPAMPALSADPEPPRPNASTDKRLNFSALKSVRRSVADHNSQLKAPAPANTPAAAAAAPLKRKREPKPSDESEAEEEARPAKQKRAAYSQTKLQTSKRVQSPAAAAAATSPAPSQTSANRTSAAATHTTQRALSFFGAAASGAESKKKSHFAEAAAFVSVSQFHKHMLRQFEQRFLSVAQPQALAQFLARIDLMCGAASAASNTAAAAEATSKIAPFSGLPIARLAVLYCDGSSNFRETT